MVDFNKYDVKDLVTSAIEQKPVDFESTFGSLMLDKINTAIAGVKQQIATSMFDNNDYVDDVSNSEDQE